MEISLVWRYCGRNKSSLTLRKLRSGVSLLWVLTNQLQRQKQPSQWVDGNFLGWGQQGGSARLTVLEEKQASQIKSRLELGSYPGWKSPQAPGSSQNESTQLGQKPGLWLITWQIDTLLRAKEYLLSCQLSTQCTVHGLGCPCLTLGTLPAFSCLQKAGDSTDSSKAREPVLQIPEPEHIREGLLALAAQCLLTKKENHPRGKPAFLLLPITITLGHCNSRPVETTHL